MSGGTFFALSLVLILVAYHVAGIHEHGGVISGLRTPKPDPNRVHMKWNAWSIEWPFDPGLPTPGNIGGWCEEHGNVACILENVNTSIETDCRPPTENVMINPFTREYKEMPMPHHGKVPCWKVEDSCDMMMVQGNLEVTFLPRASTFITGIFDRGLIAMQDSLSKHPKLRTLGINNNKLGPDAARALASIIRAEYVHPVTTQTHRTNKLKSLIMTLNRLGPEGTAIVAEAIAIQHRFGGDAWRSGDGTDEIYLDSNVIGDLGAAALGKLLNTNINQGIMIKMLSLRSNRITDIGAQHLLNGITAGGGNNQLLFMPLAENNISPHLMNQINTRLETNCCHYLYEHIKMREVRECVELTKVPCPTTAAATASKIMTYYRDRSMCCQRVSFERCF